MNILETDRLILREFNEGDAEFILELLNSLTWLQFIGDRGVKNISDAGKYISDKLIMSYRTNGFGLYMTMLKKEKIPIGMCGLIKRDTLEDVDIGFALSPGYTGHGYAYEAALATLNYGNTVLKLPRIVAITAAENINSISLLKKLKLTFEKKINFPDDKEELLLFTNK